jgi:hypothetical protein
LPIAAQYAPDNAIVCTDVDNDGIKDLILAGNEYQADVFTGRYDASYGCVLKGSKQKSFEEIELPKSGLIIDGDVKAILIIETPTRE